MTAMQEIVELVGEFDFPEEVLRDVNHRIESCRDEAYLRQQLRYLKNVIAQGFATSTKQS